MQKKRVYPDLMIVSDIQKKPLLVSEQRLGN